MTTELQHKTLKTQVTNLLIVDGLNVLKYQNGDVNPLNLDIVRKWANENGVSPIFILPGFKKFYKTFQNYNDVILIDPRIYDDLAILEYARQFKAPILSNDKYREFRKMFYDLDFNRVFPFVIASGRLMTNAIEHLPLQRIDFPSLSTINEYLGGFN